MENKTPEFITIKENTYKVADLSEQAIGLANNIQVIQNEIAHKQTEIGIYQLAFNTLIDHFTSLDAESSLVLSDQLIKLELLTQSIRQQKLPPHAVRFAAFDPAVRMALAGARGAAAVASCFGKTLGIIPIETTHCSKICTPCQSLFDKNRTCRPYLH